MSWLEHSREPLASTREEAARYIEGELRQAAPKGWAVRRMDGDKLAWSIVKTDIQVGEWQNKEYCVELSKGLDLLDFTYGNKDVGPFSLHHALLRSLTIHAGELRHFGLATCLQHLMRHYEPNEWGYT